MSQGFYSHKRDVLDDSLRAALIAGILGSEFYADSALGKEFVETKGFSLVFKRSAMDTVAASFPYLASLLEEVMFEESNAFYVNPLVLFGGSRVDPHIDCRVVSPDDVRIIPNIVSVYYAEVAKEMDGGRLILNSGKQNEIAVRTQTNELVHFLGNVVHHVEEIGTTHRRISVVCEQYNLDDELLAAFPQCEVISGISTMHRLNALEA